MISNFSRAVAELPRWQGTEDSWIDFADEAVRTHDPPEGLSIYARIFCSHQGTAGGGLENPRLDWKKVRQGFRDIEKAYPDSNWNLNNFCHFACLAGDRETARELFKRIGNDVSLSTWESRAAHDKWRAWAEADEAASRPQASPWISHAGLQADPRMSLVVATALRCRVCPAPGAATECRGYNQTRRSCGWAFRVSGKAPTSGA